MRVLLARVRLPNRPGSLGAVASALGAIGASINLVEIVEKAGAVEIDEFILDLPPAETVASLVAACDLLPGVQVDWVRNYPRGGGVELDVELHRRMSSDAAPAGETLVSAAPLVFRAQWSLLLDVSGVPRVVLSTPDAPPGVPDSLDRFRPFDVVHRVVLEPGWLPVLEGHQAMVAPLGPRQTVVVGRQGDPPFFRSELLRLAHLVDGPVTVETEDRPDDPRCSAPVRNLPKSHWRIELDLRPTGRSVETWRGGAVVDDDGEYEPHEIEEGHLRRRVTTGATRDRTTWNGR